MLEARGAQLPGVQLAQPLPLLSRGNLSAKCLVILWSGPRLSLLSIFLYFRRCSFLPQGLCGRKRYVFLCLCETHAWCFC